ncbi:MAG: ABC transporter permease subunit [Oscillospiraceae bacterium]|nr:ABC transporter permease subunit [Oscillospiraceae bacterium]
MKKFIVLLMCVFLILTTAACSDKVKSPLKGTRTYEDFIDSGKDIAVQSGEVFNIVAKDLFKAGEVPEYSEMAGLLEALRMGRADAVMTDGSYVKQLEDSGQFPEFDYLWIAEDFFVNKSAPVFHTSELRDKYNEWFAGIKADGTFDEIENRWIGVSLPAQEDIPKFEFTGENGILQVCDTGNYPPFTYFDANNEPTGFDVEIISLFAQHIGMKPEFTMMPYAAIIPYIISGKSDMSACQFTITEERGGSVLFGAPTIVTQAVLIVPKNAVVSAEAQRDYTEFAGKNIAVITGVLTYNTTEKIGAKPVEYNDSASAAEDVRKGRVAGYMHALTAVQVMAAQLDGFEVIPVPKDIFKAQIGGISQDQSVIDRFNAFLAVAEADGTLDDIKNRWFGDALDLDAPVPDISNTGENGVLKVAVCSDSIPYVYSGANGNYSGFSVELALRFGAYEEKTIEFTDMEFGGLIPYIVSQKADLGIANMAITEERKKSVLFTEPFFDEQHGILALKTGGQTAANPSEPLTFSDFTGKRVGAVTGNLSGEIISGHLGVAPAYYSEQSAGIEDVRKGRIDGFMTDLSILRVMAASPGFEDTQVISVPAEIFAGPLGAFSMDQDIIDRFNAFLKQLDNDGTLDDMRDRWLENVPDSDSPMPDIPLTGENGTLSVATSGVQLPFSYFSANNELKGYSIELAIRFAAHEGMNIEFASMDFAGLIPYVVSGKADLGIDAVTITEERKKSVLFSDSIYDDLLGIITLKKSTDTQKGGFNFIEWLRVGIERNLLTDNRWKMILNGLGVTMAIALLAQLFGTVLGCFVCWLLTRKNKFVRWIGSFYCGLIHGTPIVVLLMITYYIIFGNTTISNVLIAIAAFTMVMGAGVAQNLKGGIETVDPVEIEAARSIGFSAFKAFMTVTLPQAVRRALPGYTNGFVELVKATAIVGYIAIQDLTRAGDIIRSRTYDAYFPLVFVAVIYLIVTTVCVQLFKFIVKKVNKDAIGANQASKATIVKSAVDYKAMPLATLPDAGNEKNEIQERKE